MDFGLTNVSKAEQYRDQVIDARETSIWYASFLNYNGQVDSLPLTHSNDPHNGKKFGIIYGSTGWGSSLTEEMQKSGYDFELFGWSLDRIPQGDSCTFTALPFQDPSTCLEILSKQRLDYLVHVGKPNIFNLYGHYISQGLDVSIPEMNRRALQYLIDYFGGITASSINLISPKQLFDLFDPKLVGQSSCLSSLGKIDLKKLRERTQSILNETKYLALAQAAVFDLTQATVTGDEVPIGVEITTTDDLIISLSTKPKGALRILVKIAPNIYPPELDPPALGGTTIENAKKFGFDIILLDAVHGMVKNREEIEKNLGHLKLIGI